MDFLEYAFDHVRSGVALVAGDGTVLRVNRAGAAIVGRRPAEMQTDPFLDLVHPEDADLATAELGATLGAGHGGPIELRIRRPDGSYVWIRTSATLLPTPEPTIYVVFEDISDEREVRSALAAAQVVSSRRAAQQVAVAVLGNAALAGSSVAELTTQATELVAATLEVPSCSLLLDDGHPDGLLLVAASGRFAEQVGTFRRPRDAGMAKLLAEHGPSLVGDLRSEERFLPAGGLVESASVSMAGASIGSRSGPPGLLVVGADVADRFDHDDLSFLGAMANVLGGAIDAARSIDELRHNAQHDALTDLPNRLLLLDRLDRALEAAEAAGTQVAVLIGDLDRFKLVNDGLGHAVGDTVLCVAAERLQLQLRPGDTVGRFGGDEFVVVCQGIEHLDAVLDIAERLSAAVSQPMRVQRTELVVTMSFGIALGATAGVDVGDGLLRDADAAMYRAKALGRHRYELFDDDMRTQAAARLRTEHDLRRALEGGELALHYQPVVRLHDLAVVGVEALIRWQHPQLDLLQPAEFLPVAGDSGLLAELGRWVFTEACRQSQLWATCPGWEQRWVAVNLAPRQLADARVLEHLDAAIEAGGCDPTRLRVELIEDALVEDSVQAIGVLDGLRARGIGVSVDDFGTGYSSLAYLKSLPVDCLKLDQTFVAGLADGGDDLVIATAVIVMAQALGLQVVAEGVEDRAQLDVLRAMGCDMVQGFLFAPPLPPDELVTWLAAHERASLSPTNDEGDVRD